MTPTPTSMHILQKNMSNTENRAVQGDYYTTVATRHEEHRDIAPCYRHRRHSYDVGEDDAPPPDRDVPESLPCLVWYIIFSRSIAEVKSKSLLKYTPACQALRQHKIVARIHGGLEWSYEY